MPRTPPPHHTLAARHFARAREHESDAALLSAVAGFFMICAYHEAVTSDLWGMASSLCAAGAMVWFVWGAVVGKRREERRGNEALKVGLRNGEGR